MLQVFINGPPGAGKTTLSKLLCAELQLEHLATGDLLKDNIAQRTELGRAAQQCIAAQQLVPDHVVVDMVAERVLACSLRGQGYVLDGFPRTVDQCAALRRKMIAPTVVLLLELPKRECTMRITGRRFDTVSGRIYHLPNVAPTDVTVLARLTKRGDDTAAKLAPRFEAYATHGEQTNALFRAVAHHIDAIGKTPSELLEDVLALLHAIRPTSSLISLNTSTRATTLEGSNQQSVYRSSSSDAVALGARHATIRSSQRQMLKQQQPQPQPQTIDEADDEDADRSSDWLEHHDDVSHSRTSSSNSSNNDDDELPSSLPSTGDAVARRLHSIESLTAAPATRTIAPPLTSQSGVDMAAFKDLLLDGFEVLKHGRRGRPHTRLVYTDLDFKRIFWQKATAPAKDGSRTKRARLDQSLVLADVLQVVRGIKTDVLKRTGDVARYERYLSLVADDRTLDFELRDAATCDLLARGFDALLHGGSGSSSSGSETIHCNRN